MQAHIQLLHFGSSLPSLESLTPDAGVPEPYNVAATPTDEAAVLSITKAAFHELLQSFPDHLEGAASLVLSQHACGSRVQLSSASAPRLQASVGLHQADATVRCELPAVSFVIAGLLPGSVFPDNGCVAPGIITSLLESFGLSRDGAEMRGGGGASASKGDDGVAQMRKALKVLSFASSVFHACDVHQGVMRFAQCAPPR